MSLYAFAFDYLESDADARIDEKQEEDEEDEPLIHSLRASSKLRSLNKKGPPRKVDGGQTTEEFATPKTSGNI